jgi:hypothetical protein
MLAEAVTPPVQRTFGNAEIAGYLCQRLVARLGQLHRFQFELLRKRSLGPVHCLFPSWRMSTSSSLPSPFPRVKTNPPSRSGYPFG